MRKWTKWPKLCFRMRNLPCEPKPSRNVFLYKVIPITFFGSLSLAHHILFTHYLWLFFNAWFRCIFLPSLLFLVIAIINQGSPWHEFLILPHLRQWLINLLPTPQGDHNFDLPQLWRLHLLGFNFMNTLWILAWLRGKLSLLIHCVKVGKPRDGVLNIIYLLR